MSLDPAILQVTLVAVLVAVYYGRVVRLVGEPMARQLLGLANERSTWVKTLSLADVDGVTRLLLAGILQAGFLVALVAVAPLDWGDFLPSGLDPVLVLLGVLLGVAEAAMATQLAFLASRVADALQRRGQRMTLEAWLAVGRGGWMRYYLRTAAVAPAPLLVGATGLYVIGEELIFRGVVVGTALPVFGTAAAVCLSVVLFVVAQVFYTPGWRTALFPMVGAFAVGLVHACLIVAVPDITPLVVAHLTMFLVTVL